MWERFGFFCAMLRLLVCVALSIGGPVAFILVLMDVCAGGGGGPDGRFVWWGGSFSDCGARLIQLVG
ncbi:hypothetical protein BDZ45DRAFT_670000 [Acephala macrosclerotiorum]|nr:hypothetical protein BDZ45DRAFT_670000 [Acephala macrosclerotiorum]